MFEVRAVAPAQLGTSYSVRQGLATRSLHTLACEPDRYTSKAKFKLIRSSYLHVTQIPLYLRIDIQIASISSYVALGIYYIHTYILYGIH